ncbi:MAG: archaetidylinositol phosphate synthase [Candidatus Bathyarchaeia archaeon]
MLTKFKEKIQQTLSTQARWLHTLGLKPNHITLLGIIFATVSSASYASTQNNKLFLLIAIIFLLFSGFCDAIDGVLARLYGQTTQLGGFLDSVLDRYADVLIFGGIMLGNLCNLFWGLAALSGSLLVSYSRARAEAAGVKMESVGFMERAERLLLLTIASLIALFWLDAINWAMILLAFLTNLTVIQRIIYFYKKTM